MGAAWLRAIGVIASIATQFVGVADLTRRTGKSIGAFRSTGSRSDRIARSVFEAVDILGAVGGLITASALSITDLSACTWRDGAWILAGAAHTDSFAHAVTIIATI